MNAGGREPFGHSSSDTAPRELRRAARCSSCGRGYRRRSARSSWEKGYFEVIGGDTGTQYRIYAGALTNVCEIDEKGRSTCGLCFMPRGNLPVGDVMLSQKIAVECCENRALT